MGSGLTTHHAICAISNYEFSYSYLKKLSKKLYTH
jgi:hypothetical protein